MQIFQDTTLAVMVAGIVIIIAVILASLAAKRSGLAAIFGGLVVLAFGFGLIALWFTARVASNAPHMLSHVEFNSPPMPPGEYAQHGMPPSWGISFLGIIFMGVIIGLIVAGVMRLAKGKPDSNRGSLWPVLLLLPLLGLFLIGKLSYRTYSSLGVMPPAPAPPEMIATVQKIEADIHQFEHGDIHVLMDKADAPRIALAAEAPVAEPAPKESEVKKADLSANANEGEETNETSVADAATDGDEPESSTEEQVTDAEKSQAVDTHADAKPAEKKQSKEPAEKSPQQSEKSVVSADKGSSKADESRKSDERLAKAESKAEEPRPDWLTQPPQEVNGGSWQEVIATDEYASETECRRATDILLLFKAYERIQTLAGRPYFDTSLPSLTFHNSTVMADGNVIYDKNQPEWWHDSRLSHLAQLGIGIDFVRHEMMADQYLEKVERSFGPMYKLYSKIKFSPAVDAELRREWADYERQERFWMLGAGASSVLGLLGFVYGLLKIDTWTKGYYTKRLFLGVPAAIIGGFLLLVLIDIVT